MTTTLQSHKTRRKFSTLHLIIWGYIIWSLVPVIIAIAYSFNAQSGKDFRFGGGLVTQTHHCGTTIRFGTQFPIHLSSPSLQC